MISLTSKKKKERNRTSPSFHPIILVLFTLSLSVLTATGWLLLPQHLLLQPCQRQGKGGNTERGGNRGGGNLIHL